MSLRDKIVLQLQLITPGSVAISEIMKPVEEYDNVKRLIFDHRCAS